MPKYSLHSGFCCCTELPPGWFPVLCAIPGHHQPDREWVVQRWPGLVPALLPCGPAPISRAPGLPEHSFLWALRQPWRDLSICCCTLWKKEEMRMGRVLLPLKYSIHLFIQMDTYFLKKEEEEEVVLFCQSVSGTVLGPEIHDCRVLASEKLTVQWSRWGWWVI